MSTPSTGRIDACRRRVLLVEDNDAASHGLARLLEAWGFAVVVAQDGATALHILETQPPPDFVLTDLGLPDLDGREIARRAHQLDPAPRVALITGWDLEQVGEDYAEWGIQWVFPKPLNAHELLCRLREAGG